MARDDGQPVGISEPTTVLVEVLNRNDPPQIVPGQVFRVCENVSIGTKIGRITVVDPDKSDSHVFTDTTIFSLPLRVDQNGTVLVSGTLDHEGPFSTITLFASVIDSAGASDGPESVEIVIEDANDAPEVLLLPERHGHCQKIVSLLIASSAACVLSLQVADADTRSGWGAPFLWQLMPSPSAPANHSCLDRFKINAATGQLSYNMSSTLGLDFNVQPLCTVDVTVVDAAGAKSPASRLTIRLEDYPDLPRLVRSGCALFENVSTGVNLPACNVGAVDPDSPPNMSVSLY